ncbi:MAG: hypothetical protein LAT76_09840 [Schleiferiaceae bacterium]|nr:hypothetical protein [Schleiferiaceae bacterium]
MAKLLQQTLLLSLFFLVTLSLQSQTQGLIPPLPNEDLPILISRQTIAELNIIYPLVVTEITTNNGTVIRGRLQRQSVSSNEQIYILSNRESKRIEIRIADVQELAWVAPDRRENNFFYEIGAVTHITEDEVNAGILIGGGLEFSRNLVFMGRAFYKPIAFIQVDETAFLGRINTTLGYRLNRTKKNIHTLGAGLDINRLFSYNETSAIGYSFMYEYDFQLSDRKGLAFSAMYVYIPRLKQSALMVGITLRFNKSLPLFLSSPSTPDLY